jgi:hypothetical protein
MVAVLSDVFALVYNFHVPLSSKAKLFVQRWSGGYFFFILWYYVYSGLFSIGVYLLLLRRGVVWCGVSRLLVEFCVFPCHSHHLISHTQQDAHSQD